MTKGLQWITLIYFMLLTSLFDGANVGMTKEIDNLREGVICSIETEGEETPEEAITAGYTGAFWVEKDETVYLLETYDNLVLECRKDKIREIPLSQTVLPVNLVTDESRIYVYDEVLSELQIYSKQGELLVRSEISLQEDYVKGLKKTGEEIALLTFENRRLVVDSETGEFTEFTEEDVSVNIEGYDFTEYVSTDEDGTVYAVGTSLVKDCSIIAGELTLQAVSKEGNILGCYVMPVLEYSYLPLRYVHVMENGNIYLLVPTAEAVEVRKVALRESMESAMEEISAKAKELEENYAEDTKQRKWEGKAPTERVRITREKILERALAMAEYEWVLKPKNTRVDVSAPSVTLPKEIQKIIREKEGEASWSVTMTGIPYCWGGFFAIDGGTDGLRFQRMLDMGYIS